MVTDLENQGRLLALAAFLPVLEAADFSAGEMVFPPDAADGVSRFPYGNPSETVDRFFNMLHDKNWVVPFNWPEWMATQEAKELFAEDGDAVSKASADQLSKMLTTCVRRDRFTWGDPLMEDFESGLIARIARRAGVLCRPQN